MTKLLNGFATLNFLHFSRNKQEETIHEGLFTIDNNKQFPFFIVRKKNSVYQFGANFLITPICLSGPVKLDTKVVLKKISENNSKLNISGGFIQSRDIFECDNRYFEDDNYCVYSDYRKNYRIPFGLKDEELLQRMKKDSRARVRKILRNRFDYNLMKVKSDDLAMINKFSELYEKTSIKSRFTDNYKFNACQWSSLLSDNNWELYVLEYLGKIVSGAVVTKIGKNFDYTFMGYSIDVPDASRANIIFLYKYLSKFTEGFLDLGGGINEDDHLARFKISMGGEEVRFKRIRFLFKSNHILNNSHNYQDILSERWP